MKNVVTTIGAYEAMYAAFQALVNPGDEVGNERTNEQTNKTNTRQTTNKRQNNEKASKPKNKPKTNEKIKNQKANKQTLCCYSHNYEYDSVYEKCVLLFLR